MHVLKQIDDLPVAVFETNAELGRAAAADFTAIIKQAATERDELPVIFATGNSQLSFIDALSEHPDIPWDRIITFHMDEYLGMSDQHPASFRRFLREKISDVFHPKVMYGLNADSTDIEAELTRYESLLKTHRPVACVLGIGENGHLAFNDPPADFHTTKLIKIVTLDETCRRQQVGEGHFPTLDTVPPQAVSLTIPALLSAEHLLALVPESRKAKAVEATLTGPITELCPASILRTQKHVKLYLDSDSSALVRDLVQS